MKALLNRNDVKGDKIAVVGYCFTGAMALRTAAMAPDKVAAAASFHGGRLVTEDADSPHTRIPQVKGELYFGHAVEDQSATPAQIAKLDDTLKGWGGNFRAKCMRAPCMAGPCLAARPTTKNSPSGITKSCSTC